MKLVAFGALALLGAALFDCTPATIGVGGMITLPHESARTCAGICQDLGLSLESVVVMAQNVGCVCSAHQGDAPPASSASSNNGAAGAAGGMAAVSMAQRQQQAQQTQTYTTFHH